ncbi:MAG: DEAD/DEAH box helicase [Candidatus Marinimicrobia bacterium]|nr:DEAD/DEAH box helicase [Candidatus Neomarinimicrobiota bacterium]
MKSKLLKDLELDEYIAFDVETTGLNPQADSVIEFSAILFKSGEVEEKLTFLCDPGAKLSEDITLLTGISNEMIKGKPAFEARLDEVINFIGDRPLVTHNMSFDLRFLKSALTRKSLRWKKLKVPLYDTLMLARAFYFYLSNHKLGTVSEYLDLTTENAHRAEADALNTGKVFLELVEEALLYDFDTIQTINRVLKDTQEPNKKLYKDIANLLSFNKNLSKNSAPKIDWEPPVNVVKSEHGESDADSLDLHDFFGQDSKLAQELEDFEARPQQQEFAEIVYNTFDKGKIALIEAGTGIGKSLGYIIPATVWNSKQEEQKRIVITSNTKNLQEQIFRKEIPFVAHQLKLPISAVLLKGRKNYACFTRWNSLLNNLDNKVDIPDRSNLIPLIIWLKHTKTGDISENNGFSVRYNWKIWSEICSEPGYCTTSVCKKYDGCFLGKARFAAKKADVLVVNHSLLLANAAANNKVLPPYSALIIDEAHNLEKNGYSFFADEVRQPGLLYLLNKLMHGKKDYGLINNLSNFCRQIKKLDKVNSDLNNIKDKIRKIRRVSSKFFREIIAAKDSSSGAGKRRYRLKKRYKDFSSDFPGCSSGRVLLDDLTMLLEMVSGITDRVAEFVADQPSIFEKLENEILNVLGELQKFTAALDIILESNNEDRIFWFEIGRNGSENSVKLASTPLDVGNYLQDKVFAEVDSAVLTSATLQINDSFKYLVERLGFTEANNERLVESAVGSPFIYDEQMKFITFNPENGKAGASQTASMIAQLSRETERGIMALYTSYRALKKVYKILEKNLKKDGISLLAQGLSGSRSSIIKKFREKKHSILLGTASFWEGVDVIGDALEILIIDKLPFPVPTDPIIEANAEEIEKKKGSSFYGYTIPETILKYRQGIGRLIRSSYDSGVLINLDDRIVTKRYGRFFQKAIPVENETLNTEREIIEEVRNFLK